MKVNKFIAKFMIAAFVACIVGACTDLAKIEDRLDDLDSKVTANESQISALNKNLEALKHLKDGAVISKVEETTDGYKITLSNGKELTIVMTGGSASDSVFSSAEVDGNVLVLTLAEDGSVLQVPIITGFKFEIRKGETIVEGIQKIMPGTTETYDVVQEGVASAAIVACPAGFDVELTETTLSVTALAQTKASASLSKDLAILVVSNKGLSILSKMQLELDTTPRATITAAEVVDRTSLTFSVALLNTETYKYMILPAATEAPTAETILAEGTNSTLATLTVNELQPLTEYVLYVLPVNGELTGEIASATSSTTGNDYEKYMAGLDLTVGTLTINKETYGDATLITNESEDKNIAKNGVYFVASDATNVTINGTASQLVVLSLDSAVATIKRTENKSFYVNASEENDYMIFSNIKYETVMTSGNVFGIGGDVEGAEIETILFNKCKIEVPADMNMLYGAKNILNINMTDCDVKLHNGTGTKNLFQTNTTSTYASVVFKNNVIYCTDGTISNFGLFSNNNATITSLEMRNNTLAQVYAKGASGYVSAKDVKAADVVLNLFYVPDFSTIIPDKYVGIIWVPNTVDDSSFAETIKSNLAYYNADSVPTYKIKGTYYNGVGTVYSKAKADNPIPSPDYVNGVFIPGETYKSYGAKR